MRRNVYVCHFIFQSDIDLAFDPHFKMMLMIIIIIIMPGENLFQVHERLLQEYDKK